MTAITQQREIQQFFLLSGATAQKRISLLESLLIQLEQQSIKTLVVRLRNEKESLRYTVDMHHFSHGDLFIPAASL
ncbi:MAG: hypothetical protein V2I36_19300, partial [Desulfopila sp.]|nr:hypothetical protein [Desulfopila sp.]